jgi:hypothetical protein
MEQKFKDFGIIIIWKVWLKFITIMEITMKVIFTCPKSQVREPTVGVKEKGTMKFNKDRYNIKVHLKRIVLRVTL